MKSKKILLSGLAAIILIFATTLLKAQGSTKAEIKIKTSSHCEMSKVDIETALAFEKGVKRSELDLFTKIVTIKYNPQKTTPEKIRKAISDAGYDADTVKANPEAFGKLNDCCKKGTSCNSNK
ncbi:MAG: cation transporter [Bacteroidetes bacterium]|nr:cation transporter [Bacteroidota bacterium]